MRERARQNRPALLDCPRASAGAGSPCRACGAVPGVASSRFNCSSCAFTSAIASRSSRSPRVPESSSTYVSRNGFEGQYTPATTNRRDARAANSGRARFPLSVLRNVSYRVVASSTLFRKPCARKIASVAGGAALALSTSASNSSADSSVPRSSNVNGKNVNPSVIRIHTSVAFCQPTGRHQETTARKARKTVKPRKERLT